MQDWTIAHDFSFVFGGAELVTKVLGQSVLPDAHVIYLGGDPSVASKMNANAQKIIGADLTESTYRWILPLYPAMLARLPAVEGNLLASSYAFSHHLKCTGRKIVYCHSPLRQIWSASEEMRNSARTPERLALRAFGRYLRSVDTRVAKNAHGYIATSTAVQSRIRAYYDYRSVPIVAPPLDLPALDRDNAVVSASERNGLLWVGRAIEPYKKLALLVEAMRQMPDQSLDVAGDGRDLPAIRHNAPSNVKFHGWLSGPELHNLFARAKLLVFPSEDDFGITVVEAQSFGTPVVAFRAGGALDTVREGFNGLFFDEQTPTSITAAVRNALSEEWQHTAISEDTRRRYSEQRFVSQMREALNLLETEK